jgi:mannose-6-phosphate isomerase-like protein (cupin superfamily)
VSTDVSVEQVERVDKPWGHEEIVALLEGHYVGKVLTIDAGQKLSLQHHVNKDETLCVESGRISVEYGADVDDLRLLTLLPGQRVHVQPLLLHRITAIIDSRVLETSTARLGWREDVVRHSDLYGRAGTSRP